MRLVNAINKNVNIVTLEGGSSSGGGDTDTPSGGGSSSSGGSSSGLKNVTLTNKDNSPYTAADDVGAIDASARTKVIEISGNKYNNSITGGSKADTLNGGAGNDTLIGNAGNDTLRGGNDDDILDGGVGNDRLFGEAGNDSLSGGDGNDSLVGGDGADTLLGGKGNDTLTGDAGADVFLYADGDGRDVITDYVAGEDIIKLTSGTIGKVTASGNNITFNVGSGNIKVINAKGKEIKFVDKNGNILINQSFGDKTLKVTDSSTDSVNAAIDSVVVTIDSSTRTRAVEILGNAKANVIQLGSGSATVTGGAGKDTIIYGGGNNVITDYTVKQDKLKFNVELSEAAESGNNIIFTLGTGKVTVTGAKGKEITVIDKDGKESTLVYGSNNITIGNNAGTYYKALSSVVSIDASNRTKAIEIVGNASANSIIGGKGKDIINGGDGADTITGGKGNDTLTGGAGADSFYYINGDGSDVINDYSTSDGDLIRLGKNTSISKAAFSGNDLILTIGSGKLTVKGGANQTVTVVDADDMETTYKKRSRAVAFQERWFTEDDNNFTTSDVASLLQTDNLISDDYRLDDELNFSRSDAITSLTYAQSQNK